MEGGGVSSFGNPGGREGGPKICLPSGGCVDFFRNQGTHSTFFSFNYVIKEMVNSSMCNYIGSRRHLEH